MVRSRKSHLATSPEPAPLLASFDLNATRARGVLGPAGLEPGPLLLEDTYEELPMVLSLEGRQAQVGRAGAGLCRLSPHLACFDFLAALGERRHWAAGRHRLDAGKAVALVLERFHAACPDVQALVFSLPAYLTRQQVHLLSPLAKKARLPSLGSVAAPLALAQSAHTADPWSGLALVLDLDDHALTATMVLADLEQLCLRTSQCLPHLNLRAWKERLVNMVAERCIRQSRRDPRDSASAEQSLYDQLEDTLDASGQGRVVELLIQTPHWFQNLLLRPEEFRSACERPLRSLLDALQPMLSAGAREAVRTVLVTATAGRLPGLVPALEEMVRQPAVARPWESSEDFGEDLIQGSDEPVRVRLLPPDAGARGAHELAGRMLGNQTARGHLDMVVPLTKQPPQPAPGTAAKRTFRVLSADQEQ